MTGDPTDDRDGPPRAVIIAAVVLGVMAVGIILLIAANGQSPRQRQEPREPLALPAVQAPSADAPACKALTGALPQRLGRFARAAVVQPVPEGAAAWQADPGTEPVVLRCGVDRPADFVVGSPIQMVDQVQWFQVSGRSEDKSTWYTVDRPVYLALTLPSGSGPAPIQELSDVIDRTIAAVPIDPADAH